ncbi:MAG: alpha/beta hydrolase [Phycisphaerales bacterium]|nr:alpha/beta hydrolase [Phycisphaerales bacterium]
MACNAENLHFPGSTTTMRCFRGAQAGRPAIVFLHGLLGDGHQWDRLDIPCRPRDYADAYYIDYHFEQRRACPLSFRELVGDTVRMLSAGPGLDHPHLALVGSSFGGHMALYLDAFRLAHPQQLILFAPGGTREAASQRGLLKSHRNIDKIIDVSFERIFSDPSVARDPGIQEMIREYRRKIDPLRRDFARNVISLSRAMKESVLSLDDLARVRAETLLVWGRNDIVTPPEICNLMAQRLRDVRVAWTDSGHAAHVECAEESSRLVREFCLSTGRYARETALTAV